MARMVVIGLTGGIGSGKTEVTRRLAGLGAVVVDADELARQVLDTDEQARAELVSALGPGVRRPDGSIDRPELASIVFDDPDRLAMLEAIVHPRVARLAATAFAAAPADAVVVYAAPLLVEKGLQREFDLVVTVEASQDRRIARLVGGRGMSEDEAVARIRVQASTEQRTAAADVVIDNDGELSALDAQVDTLWEEVVDRLR